MESVKQFREDAQSTSEHKLASRESLKSRADNGEGKMGKAMTVWGIGLNWLRWSFVFSLPVFVSAWWFRSSLVADGIDPTVFYAVGVLLLAVGVPFWFLSAITLRRSFEAEKLCTSGVFAVCRNPIYAAWILFLVPGVLLFFRIPLLLLTPLIMYGVLRVFLPREEQWLEQTYGDEYMEYKGSVNRILPTVANAFRPCSR